MLLPRSSLFLKLSTEVEQLCTIQIHFSPLFVAPYKQKRYLAYIWKGLSGETRRFHRVEPLTCLLWHHKRLPKLCVLAQHLIFWRVRQARDPLLLVSNAEVNLHNTGPLARSSTQALTANFFSLYHKWQVWGTGTQVCASSQVNHKDPITSFSFW